MNFEDLYHVSFDEYCLNEAKKDATFFRGQIGRKTRNATEERDIIGSLAHQAVEIAFERNNLYYESYRNKKRPLGEGDTTDILYEQDSIDVKGTRGEPGKWFYNKSFLVFQKQLDDPKIENITHFCFVLVKEDYSEGWIFGVISLSDFKKLSKPVTLMYENQEIRAFQLVPFNKYAFRV